jgi:inner membrane protein
MDNLTHSLTGLALARAGLNRFSPRATLLLLISANIPDIDIVALGRGQLCYLEVHRGYSHSLVLLPAMALLSVLVTAAIYRQKLPWLKAWLLCVAGVGSHLLLDWTTSYGIRLLLPFSSRWFHLDLNSLTDLVALSVLVLAALWPLFSRLVASEIGERAKRPFGRRMAVFALLFFALFDAGRAILHARAVGQLASRLYAGAPPIRAAAFPGPANPFVWRGVVESRSAYRLLSVNTLGEIDPTSAQVFYKPPVTPAIRAARATEPFRYFQYFARFPVWSVEPLTERNWEGTRVELTDLRFGTPGGGSFHCIALVSNRGASSRISFQILR